MSSLAEKGFINLPFIPEGCEQNAHMFYIKVKDKGERDRLILYLKDKGITAVFHYIPLHQSVAGKRYGRFHGNDQFTTSESERLLRLPLFYELTPNDVQYVVEHIHRFFS